MKNLIRACGLLALAVPLFGYAWPARAEVHSAPGPAAVPAPQQAAPVPCRCKPFVMVLGPFGCECPFDLLVSALKRGECTPANAAPPCKPQKPCRVSVRLFWVGEEDGCEKPPKPQFAPMKAWCGTFAPQLFFCPVGLGLVTVFLHCRKCKP